VEHFPNLQFKMAILEDVPGVRVTIESQGKTATEYDDDGDWNHKVMRTSPGKRSIKYIECISDAEFQVKTEVMPPYKPDCEHLTFWVNIDGQGVGGLTTAMHGGGWSGTVSETLTQVSEDEVVRRKFKFSSIRKGCASLSLFETFTRSDEF